MIYTVYVEGNYNCHIEELVGNIIGTVMIPPAGINYNPVSVHNLTCMSIVLYVWNLHSNSSHCPNFHS